MKKWILLVGMLIVVLGIVGFQSKFYYPPLPIDSMSKKDVLEALEDSTKDIVKIAEENSYDWYITKLDQGKVMENVKQMLSKEGWQYKTQEGSGYFFEKDNRTLIVSTERWTSNYVLLQIPSEWTE